MKAKVNCVSGFFSFIFSILLRAEILSFLISNCFTFADLLTMSTAKAGTFVITC